MKKFLALSLVFVFATPASAGTKFFDAIGSPYEDAMTFLGQRDIMGGFRDGLLHPEWTVNRAEVFKMTLQAAGTGLLRSSRACLPDAGTAVWYHQAACTALARGLPHARFHGEDRFAATEKMTAAEIVDVAAEVFGIEKTATDGDLMTAFARRRLLPHAFENPAATVDRGSFAEFLTRLIFVKESVLENHLDPENPDVVSLPDLAGVGKKAIGGGPLAILPASEVDQNPEKRTRNRTIKIDPMAKIAGETATVRDPQPVRTVQNSPDEILTPKMVDRSFDAEAARIAAERRVATADFQGMTEYRDDLRRWAVQFPDGWLAAEGKDGGAKFLEDFTRARDPYRENLTVAIVPASDFDLLGIDGIATRDLDDTSAATLKTAPATPVRLGVHFAEQKDFDFVLGDTWLRRRAVALRDGDRAFFVIFTAEREVFPGYWAKFGEQILQSFRVGAAELAGKNPADAVTSTPARAAGETTIFIAGGDFSEKKLTVRRGTRVVWQNDWGDQTARTIVVTRDGQRLTSPEKMFMNPGETAEFFFGEPGQFRFYLLSDPHGPSGEIIVSDK